MSAWPFQPSCAGVAKGGANQWQQYAKWVKGVKPKRFMEKARKDPAIAAIYKDGSKRLAKLLIEVK